METKKCISCEKRFRIHDWNNNFEKRFCLICRCRIKMILDDLSGREKGILEYRFGFNKPDYKSHTLEETGKEFGITRERVRQVEAKTFEKLRYHFNKS